MKKRWSLSLQLVITMLLLVAGTIGLCWLLNSTLLEQYYMYKKQEELLDGYKIIDRASENGDLESDDFDLEFERICTNGNINIMVYKFGDYVQEPDILWSSYTEAQLFDMRVGEISEFLYGSHKDIPEEIVTSDKYSIRRQNDNRMHSEFLILAGTLSDGKTCVYMKTALESIRESAEITNRFFIVIGGFALVVCAIVIVFVARGVSRPIKELTEISIHMTNLEFDAKYKSKKGSTQEIEVLGSHMNELSDTLQKNISELKSANNELMQDIEKKEQIDEMRKEFLSNVSHELKTPLALIQGYAEGLREGINDDAESTEFYCDVIVDEADKMNRMVKKLLTLNQLEFGNEVVDMKRFNITELVQGILNASMLLASTGGITVEFLQSQPVYVWGDEFKVEEVITNYLTNAIHYCMGQKLIRITFTERGNLLRVSVFNTGSPIPEEDLDKVWVKFYKADKARTREYGGSGIGLSIVKAIMDSFSQKCGVNNLEDGVEFWMELERSN